MMSILHRTIKIGTRGSPLALLQANMVRDRLLRVFPDLEVEIVEIITSGDWKPEYGEVRLPEADGGKGQFAKEIEQALLAGDIDAAVHSMKDMDSNLPDGLIIDHMLEREDPRDVILLSNKNKNLFNTVQLKDMGFDALPQGCVVGTASVRRGAFLIAERPDLEIVPFRGNVQTRIEKLRGENPSQEMGCTLLAFAGLKRLNLQGEADVILSPEQMLPAAGQGAVGVEIRGSNEDILSIFSHISHLNTVICVKAEREVLRVLDGSCHTPIGAYALFDHGALWLRVCVVSLDGKQRFFDEARGSVDGVDEAIHFGRKLGEKIKKAIPQGVLNAR